MAAFCDGLRYQSSSPACGSILQSTADQLLLEVKREVGEFGRISEDLVSALLFVFQAPLHQALDLLDRGDVTRYHCPAGRELYRVKGSSGRLYTCLTTSHYCSCPSFVYTVLVKQDSLLCKHLLAVQLGRAIAGARDGGGEERAEKEEREEINNCLPTVEEVSVSNEEFARMMMMMTNTSNEPSGTAPYIS